jgi:release factor glutamine methyltransferase
MQLRAALRLGLKALNENQVPSSQLAAELLLMHVLGCDRGYLHTHPEVELPDQDVEHYFKLLGERSTGKPTQYITGPQEFWGLDFLVTPDVLIPRPETEHVVEAALELSRGTSAAVTSSALAREFLVAHRETTLRIIDVGTGSGSIALALASELARATIFATDISWPALGVARRNAERLGIGGKLRFVQADLLECFLPEPRPGTAPTEVSMLGESEDQHTVAGSRSMFDFVVSNPPYVGEDQIDWVQREVREFEPRLAWGGSSEGEAVYRRLIPQAAAVLRGGGYLVVEIGYSMGESVPSLFGRDWSDVTVRPDLAGIPRVVIGRKRP